MALIRLPLPHFFFFFFFFEEAGDIGSIERELGEADIRRLDRLRIQTT